jgi:hypothetical protein
MIWSYIGDLDDPDFSWDRPSDATPRGESLGVDVFWVMRAIKEGATTANSSIGGRGV